MKLANFWNLVPDKASLSDLSMEQAQAIFRLMIIGTFADDEVTTPERLVLAQAVVNLPFFDPADWKMFETTEGIGVLTGLFDRFHDEEQLPTLMDEIKVGLGDEPTCILGLRMMTLLMQSDSFADAEYDFCLLVGQALGLDKEETTVVIQDAVAQAQKPQA